MRITFSQLGHWGRLGNQLFEIATTVGLAEQYGAEVAFPPWGPAPFFTYQLPVGPAERVARQRKLYYDDSPIITSCDLRGYMQSYKHFPIDWKQRFAFTPEFLAKMRGTLPPNWFDKPTVCIHVRRGDFVNSPIGMYSPPIQFFFSAIETYFGDLDSYNFYIISDDIAYCRTYFECLPSVIFASETGTPVEHMALGSLMQHFIISGSTFAWWTAWLGEKPGSKIIYNSRLNVNIENPLGYWPEHWTRYDGPDYRFKMRDLTFVIGYKRDHNDRYDNFVANIAFIRRACDTVIAIGEQAQPTLAGNKSIDIYMFMYDLIVFHRTRLFNRVVRSTTTPFIVLWDIDCFFSPLALYVMLYRLRSGVAMVYPYNVLAKCQRTNYQAFLQGELHRVDVEKRGVTNGSAGGAIGFNVKDFVAGGMQNEYIVEWGADDWEQKRRFEKLGYCSCRVNGLAYHLNHFRLPAASGGQHPAYEHNVAEDHAAIARSKSETEAYIATWPWRTQYV